MKTRFSISGWVCVVVLAAHHQFPVCAAESARPVGTTAELDLNKPGEPISKYIYGQFIEHLGRCIYGGIWAEMVEDRKFYFPVTDDYNPFGTDTDRQWKAGEYKYLKASPWKVIGPAGTVAMDNKQPFVGSHTPVVRLPGDGNAAGISQEGLSTIRGKTYNGRIVLSGDAAAAPVLVRLVLDNGATLEKRISNLGPDYSASTFNFIASRSSDNARLEVVSKGKGSFKIGAVSLMPSDNIKGWRKDTVSLLKQLDSPVYRWPGGNFVSGYNWKDGIGQRDKRPPRKNPAWKGIEHNDVGIHEFMDLMDLLKSEAYIAVNTGLGTMEEVAQEVEYVNGPATTRMGSLRASNGHPAPYNVKWWAVGNEMYGNWQLGHMSLADYLKKHQRVAEAMWKVDPSLKLVGVGAVGAWTKAMLTNCSDSMTLISEHIYVQDKTNVADHTALLAKDIRRVADAHREYRRTIPESIKKPIPVAMDEWNYWYGNYIYGELGVRYFHKDGLGVARGLHEYFRNSDIYFMANYAQTVNVIGAIKTSSTAAEFESTGLVLRLYREEFGTIPIPVSSSDKMLDVSAAWTSDRKAITVAVVNSGPEPRTVDIKGSLPKLKPRAKQWLIANPDPLSYNEPGKPPVLQIKQSTLSVAGGTLVSPPYSVAIYRISP